MTPNRDKPSAVKSGPAAPPTGPTRPSICRAFLRRLSRGPHRGRAPGMAALRRASRLAGIRRTGHPGRHRYASRRSVAGVRLSGRTDAGPDGVRARRRRIRPRLRARATDAALPRVDVHGAPSLRAQGPRQPGVHVERPGTPTLAGDVSRGGIHDRGIRFSIRVTPRDGRRAGVRRLRRDVSGDGRGSVGRPGPAARARKRWRRLKPGCAR